MQYATSAARVTMSADVSIGTRFFAGLKALGAVAAFGVTLAGATPP